MTQCSRCGLVSDDDTRCTWCGTILATKPAAVISELKTASVTRSYGSYLIAGGCLLLIACLLIVRSRASSEPAEVSPVLRTASTGTTGSADASRLPMAYSPGRTSGSVNLNRRSNVPGPTYVADEPPVPAQDATEPDDDAGAATTSAGTQAEPQETTLPVEQGSIQLLDARLAMSEETEGQAMAGGRVIVVNDGPYDVTDYRVTLLVGGTSYALTPFSGNPDNPVALVVRTIGAGERVEIPVMTMSPFRHNRALTTYQVNLRVTMDGPPTTITRSIAVPSHP